MSDRKLAAVMVTDIVGYTAMLVSDQKHAVALVEQSLELIQATLADYGGTEFHSYTDKSYTVFPSATDAVNCALAILKSLDDKPDLQLRIGINLGEIILVEGRLYGEIVNIASAIERLAEPNGLVITQSVHDAIRGELELRQIDLGQKLLKGLDNPVRLYAVSSGRRPHPPTDFMATLILRRVPHISGAYLAAIWIVIEVTDFLAGNGLLPTHWVYPISIGLLSFTPAVVLMAFVHGAHGREKVANIEKVGVPLNLVVALTLALTLRAPSPITVSGAEAMPIASASIAVLKFVNLSSDVENDYFGSGLSEELINALAKVPDLYVASRSSSFIFDDPDVDPRDVANRLRVATVLEGSIRMQGDKMRVTAQLIDGENNYHLWTDTYDRNVTDIFEIQEDIAKSVTAELLGILKPEVPPIFAADVASISAYDYYLRGLSFLRRPPTAQSLISAQDLFIQAIDEDSQYPQAYAALCETLLERYRLLSTPSLLEEATTNCTTASGLAGDLFEVRFANASLAVQTGKHEEATMILEGLLAEQPNAGTWVQLGKALEAKGDFDAAEVAYLTASKREPGNWQNLMALGEFYFWQDRHADVLSTLERVVELSPDNARAYLLIGATHDYLGNLDKAFEATFQAIAISPTGGAYRDLGLRYYENRDYEKAVEAFQRATELSPDSHWVWGNYAHLLGLTGDSQASKTAYQRAAELARQRLSINPSDWLALARLAVYTVSVGNVADAKDFIGQAVEEGGHLSEVHFYDAVIHLNAGEPAEAVDAIDQALNLGLPLAMIIEDQQFDVLRDDEAFLRITSQQ